jgi:hypothetical protein
MLRLEIVSDNAEMRRREYAGALGAGTSLLLRLAKDFSGSGRVIIADPALRPSSRLCGSRRSSVSTSPWRFVQTFLGINVIDSFLAYIKFAPRKAGVTRRLRPGSHRRSADKKYGVPDSHPVLRPLPEDHSEDENLLPASVHDLQLLRLTPFFLRKTNKRMRAVSRSGNAHCDAASATRNAACLA